MADYADTELGKTTIYSDQYDASLLDPIPRTKARQAELPVTFIGVDLWTAFEISWLNPQGLPQIAIGEFIFFCTSEAIVESKSFKLYLNSLIQTRFDSRQQVIDLLSADLSAATGSKVDVILYDIEEYNGLNPIAEPKGSCLDHQQVTIEAYQPDADLLSAKSDHVVTETLYSHLLKTNCPVTDQPDWASIYISYTGPQIDRAGLLQYIVSFRQHQDFHEQCVEKFFTDILLHCHCAELTVYARYMRRGGLDINPFRSTSQTVPPRFRQVRQ